MKSCQTVYTTIRFDGQSSSIMSQGFCLVNPILELTKLANVMVTCPLQTGPAGV
ncbi:hypothetical protein DM75_3759 [Burkholderia mallei]|nr:hypothetical protein DM75_3759 [Burkholderia mallei]KOS76251.1 hypothetical protein DM46_2302 [Burkholderia mallei]